MQALLAVHISDNLLAPSWWLGGFALMAGLVALGALRIRDEEIPRIAVLTSAFFIASLIHVRVGPTSAHLLLNGLLGVVLGWRAAVAIPIAVFLQAVLFGHGGFTTIGINSCILILPALAAGGLFTVLQKLPWIWRPWFRFGLVTFSCLAFLGSAIFGVSLLWAAPVSSSASPDATTIQTALETAWNVLSHPVVLLLILCVSLLAALAERKLENVPEFPLGLLIGELSVLATVVLNCFVLLAGGESNWAIPASILVIAHLPIAVVEGLVLGFTVGLLARVRPDILGTQTCEVPGTQYRVLSTEDATKAEKNRDIENESPRAGQDGRQIPNPPSAIRNLQSAIANQKHLIAILVIALIPTGSAWAHRLKGDYKVLPGKQVRVEGWFDLTAESATGAVVQAIGENGEPLAEGKLDEKGTFSFSFARPQPLRIVISAGAGHREELHVSSAELKAGLSAEPSDEPGASHVKSDSADRQPSILRIVLKALLGIGVVTGIAILFLAWRHRPHPA